MQDENYDPELYDSFSTWQEQISADTKNWDLIENSHFRNSTDEFLKKNYSISIENLEEIILENEPERMI